MDDKILIMLRTISEVSKSMKKGEERIICCPSCEGKMRIIKAQLNGHIHAECFNCKVKLIQ